jgi:hypothetical protein
VIGRVVLSRLFGCADWIGVDAPVAHPIGVWLQVRYLRLATWEVAVNGGAAAPVVGLVCDVASVAEDDDGSN